MTEFWPLPGPARFLRDVAEELRAGNNVVLGFPEHAPDGWLTALHVALSGLSLPRMEEIIPDGTPPLATLHAQLELGNCTTRASVTDICSIGGFQGRLLHVRQFTAENWPAWRAFLFDYEDACRHRTLAERTLFVATLLGHLAAHAPAPANLLRVHQWPGRVDGLNIRLYTATLLTDESMPPWQRQMAVAVLAELALWDPAVCDAGARRGLRGLLDPADWLAELGHARGWSANDDAASSSAEWRGHRQSFEGRSRLHSAWLALAGKKETLSQRVWNGQVAALFPLLERQRRALLKTHSSLLRVPWQTQFGRIERIEDLELNHIADQFSAQRSGGLRDICEFVCWLRDMRNDLAHLTPVSAVRVLNERFQDRLTRALESEEE